MSDLVDIPLNLFFYINFYNTKKLNYFPPLSIFYFIEADKLCGRLYQKLNTVVGQKVVMDHMPLLMVCLEGLGKLAKKFPNIAGTSISYLRDFLVDPSPILAKLHAQAVAQQKKDKEMIPFKIIGK